MIRKAYTFFLFLILSATCSFSQESAASPYTITLRAISGLQYDQVRFQVAPGSTVRLTFINTDEMAHNVIFSKPGYREEIVSLALELGDQGNAKGFIPASDKIIAAIPLLSPDEEQTIEFRVPDIEGVYPYVCTYPGHGTIMYGAMYVSRQQMPPLAKDIHVPPNRREEGKEVITHRAHHHPYPDILPMMYRTFMPDCGPAGIAVGMPGGISYCWDAGQCRLRYTWKGGFLDLTENWSGKGKERAEITGTVFYRDSTKFPFRIGSQDHIPQAGFQGYTLQDRYPTFQYTLDGAEVTERIVPSVETPGIKRILTFRNLKAPLWYAKTDNKQVNVYCNKGHWEGNYLKLSPEEAREFTIVITEKSEGI